MGVTGIITGTIDMIDMIVMGDIMILIETPIDLDLTTGTIIRGMESIGAMTDEEEIGTASMIMGLNIRM